MTKNDLRSSTVPPFKGNVSWNFYATQNGERTGETKEVTAAFAGKTFARLAKERWIEENRRAKPTEPCHPNHDLLSAEIAEWLRGPIILEKAQHSVAHKIVPEGAPIETHILLVQHDWAKLMATAEISGPDSEDPRLPYPCSLFEFAFRGGVRFVSVLLETQGFRGGKEYIKTKSGWLQLTPKIFIAERDIRRQGATKLQAAIDMVWANIRAICAMLEAEVVEATPTRMPYKPNAPKEGAPPPTGISHHIVSLANRRRVGRLHTPGEPGHHKRLHFRRGHWRHYETHKTWIKWTLVGNPDLGFVDKEYTL